MRTKEQILKEIENAKHSFEFNTKFHTKCLEKLQKELEELNKPKRWKPEVRDFYWFINPHGEVVDTDWLLDNYDKFRYKTRNCFKTKEEAEEELERTLFVNEVRDFIEEENDGWEPDFTKEGWDKHALGYDGYLRIDSNNIYKGTSSYKYFKSEEIGKKILAKFDNEKLIKYWI